MCINKYSGFFSLARYLFCFLTSQAPTQRIQKRKKPVVGCYGSPQIGRTGYGGGRLRPPARCFCAYTEVLHVRASAPGRSPIYSGDYGDERKDIGEPQVALYSHYLHYLHFLCIKQLHTHNPRRCPDGRIVCWNNFSISCI